jgi:hypothetical protein
MFSLSWNNIKLTIETIISCKSVLNTWYFKDTWIIYYLPTFGLPLVVKFFNAYIVCFLYLRIAYPYFVEHYTNGTPYPSGTQFNPKIFFKAQISYPDWIINIGTWINGASFPAKKQSNWFYFLSVPKWLTHSLFGMSIS